MAEISAPTTVDLEPVQLVAADGTPTSERRYSRDLPAETLCWLYEMMVVTRELDAEFVNLKRQGQLALFASCRGQEAAQVGAASACARPTGCFPNIVSSVLMWCAASCPDTWRPHGAEPGTAGWNSPRNAALRCRFRSAPKPCMPSARQWPRNASVKIR